MGIPANGSNFWSFSTDDAAGSPAWRRAFPLDAGTDLNGRFVGAAIAGQNAVFPITPPEYADPAPNPDPAPAPEQDAAANDAGSNNQRPAAANQQPRANNPVANSPVGNSRVANNPVANSPVGNSRVANNPAVRAASARPSASASNAATPRASSSPSPSVVWGGDATPEDAPRQGNSPARLWLLGGIGAVALGVIIWGSVMLYRMRRVDSGDPSGALNGIGADAGLDADSQPGTPGPDGVIPDGQPGSPPATTNNPHGEQHLAPRRRTGCRPGPHDPGSGPGRWGRRHRPVRPGRPSLLGAHRSRGARGGRIPRHGGGGHPYGHRAAGLPGAARW
ncbi:Hypothetical protein CB129slpB_0248 [Propionibacterium freudenreichii]|nr:Hypothetical protein CB129slpB_0248 [Propionibacterium freudenreichii]